MSDHGHKFHGAQCLKCGILDHEGTRNVDVIRHCPGNSRFAPTALVEVLANEVRELRALLTPADPGSLPRDVPVLGTTPVPATGDCPRCGLEIVTDTANSDRNMMLVCSCHLSPADRESARRLNEALAEEMVVMEWDPVTNSFVGRKVQV